MVITTAVGVVDTVLVARISPIQGLIVLWVIAEVATEYRIAPTVRYVLTQGVDEFIVWNIVYNDCGGVIPYGFDLHPCVRV